MVLAAKSNDLCLIPGTRMVKAETRLPQTVSDLHMHAVAHIRTHMLAYVHAYM